MSMTVSQHGSAAVSVLGVYGGAELIERGGDICLRPASWGECFYAKIATYLQIATVIVITLLVDSLNLPTNPVIIVGTAIVAAFPICWEFLRRWQTRVVYTRRSGEIFVLGREKATLRQLSLEVSSDRINGNTLFLIVEGGAPNRHRIMGHIDKRPLENLAMAIEDQLGIKR